MFWEIFHRTVWQCNYTCFSSVSLCGEVCLMVSDQEYIPDGNWLIIVSFVPHWGYVVDDILQKRNSTSYLVQWWDTTNNRHPVRYWWLFGIPTQLDSIVLRETKKGMWQLAVRISKNGWFVCRCPMNLRWDKPSLNVIMSQILKFSF